MLAHWPVSPSSNRRRDKLLFQAYTYTPRGMASLKTLEDSSEEILYPRILLVEIL